MEPLVVYINMEPDNTVDAVHCHKGWKLAQVFSAHGPLSLLEIEFVSDATDQVLPVTDEISYRRALSFCERDGPDGPLSLVLECRARGQPPLLEAVTVHITDLRFNSVVTTQSRCFTDSSFASVFGGLGDPAQLTVTYKDDENDSITVGSEQEWAEALRFRDESGVLRVTLGRKKTMFIARSLEPEPKPEPEPDPEPESEPEPEQELARPQSIAAPASPTVAATVAASAAAGGIEVHVTDMDTHAVTTICATVDSSFASVFGRFSARLCTLQDLRVTYLDDEKDTITIGSEGEWCEALNFRDADGVLRVDLVRKMAHTEAMMGVEETVTPEPIVPWAMLDRIEVAANPGLQWDASSKSLTCGSLPEGTTTGSQARTSGPAGSFFATNTGWGLATHTFPARPHNATSTLSRTTLSVLGGYIELCELRLLEPKADATAPTTTTVTDRRRRVRALLDGQVVRCMAASGIGTELIAIRIGAGTNSEILEGLRVDVGSKICVEFAASTDSSGGGSSTRG
eukprot:COSAG05_NODE_655_length_8069_cov_3.477666_3_plen_514_part_00